MNVNGCFLSRALREKTRQNDMIADAAMCEFCDVNVAVQHMRVNRENVMLCSVCATRETERWGAMKNLAKIAPVKPPRDTGAGGGTVSSSRSSGVGAVISPRAAVAHDAAPAPSTDPSKICELCRTRRAVKKAPSKDGRKIVKLCMECLVSRQWLSA
jgi:hypothetical protein